MFVSFVDLYLFSFPLSYWLYIILFHMSSDFVCVCVCVCVIYVVGKPKLDSHPLFLYFSNS